MDLPTEAEQAQKILTPFLNSRIVDEEFEYSDSTNEGKS